MRKCQSVEWRLSAYLDGQLQPTDRAAVEAHLRECPKCAAMLRAMRVGVEALRSMRTTEVSDAFWQRLRERLPQEKPTGWQRWVTALRWGWTERQQAACRRLAAAAIGVVILIGSWTGVKNYQGRVAAEQYAEQCAERHSLYLVHQPFGDATALSGGLSE
ncbi:MAG: zf-HC2 domain-containing protein [Abditibacteriales bacterium]|nr:zf-HC2 domain-containing protein [Abditibacteriales bacterium]MDW8368367.1 zf-HC2 domain-containing protein [Abditibacteriales bacterium]